MKILVIADMESKALWDYFEPEKLEDVDLIISCGDLNPRYLEFLVTMAHCPLVYVHGNHDGAYEKDPPEGCECIADRIYRDKGLRILGLGGCMRYNPGPYQYTEKEMAGRIRRMRGKLKRMGVDIVIAHAPPKGYGDAPDNAHKGFESFVGLMDEFHPRYLIHGHVHQSYGHGHPRTYQCGETTVMNAVGWHILELDVPQPPEAKGIRRILEKLKKQN